MMNRRDVLAAAVGAACLRPVLAQGYPERTITLVAPFPAAGSVDVIARLVAARLGERLKQSIVVDNRLGAGGVIGAAQVAKAAPDGYTLLLSSTSTHSMAAATKPTLPYDVERGFAPIVPIAYSRGVVLVSPSLGVQSMSELFALMRAKPGESSYGSAGIGTVGHLNVEAILGSAGLRATHVPYKGTSLAMQDLLGGRLTMLWDSLTSAIPSIQGGKVRALAVTGNKRSPVLPEIPTLAESGVTGLSMVSYFGLWAPAGTPPTIIDTLNKSMNALLSTPAFMAELDKLSAEPGGGTPEAFAQRIAQDTRGWKDVITRYNIAVGE